MATNAGNVARLYDTIVDYEDTRLATHPMERELTLRAIRESLGPGPKRVADIGGGPGRIAFPLADEGYLVDLIDLSPGLIKLAQTEQNIRKATEPNKPVLQSINVGNALATHNLPEAAYDAVLLLGPLYHLVAEEERAQAIENALLLTKPGGLLFVAFISVAAHLRDIAVRDPKRLVEEKDFYDRYVSWTTKPARRKKLLASCSL
jgi:2-polyprenyl-3-methyl-5-hydroxy-6-metoxy-1,4-benzoquinol methylase